MDKSDKPIDKKTAKKLIEVVKSINDAVEQGKIPTLHNKFERGIFKRSKDWWSLGHGSIHKGIDRWVKGVKRREERWKLESSVWKVLMELYESPDPNERILAEIIKERFTYSELSSLVNEILAVEMKKSPQELPGVAPHIHNPSRPWENSRPEKRERDHTIWYMRNENYTWAEIAKELKINEVKPGITTLKENFNRMQALSRAGARRKSSKISKKSV